MYSSPNIRALQINSPLENFSSICFDLSNGKNWCKQPTFQLKDQS